MRRRTVCVRKESKNGKKKQKSELWDLMSVSHKNIQRNYILCGLVPQPTSHHTLSALAEALKCQKYLKQVFVNIVQLWIYL